MYSYFKRIADFTVALVVLVALSPLLILVWLAIRVNMGRPTLFRQARAGMGGKPFSIFKFRSMNSARDEEGNLLPDEQRLTPLGKFLRRTSLDELPQLLNVLQGDMSLVGPRPLYQRYVERYTPQQARRLEVRPGITGLAQVNGRNSISWEARFVLDVEYVDKVSLLLDLSIFAKTVAKVVSSKGISQEGKATMDEFMGSGRG